MPITIRFVCENLFTQLHGPSAMSHYDFYHESDQGSMTFSVTELNNIINVLPA